MARTLTWNGHDLPSVFRDLPAGEYMIERVDAAPTLSIGDEGGLQAGLDSIAAGRGIPAQEVERRIAAVLRRGR